MPFNQQMSFPRELTLKRTPDGLRLFNTPVREIASLHAKRHAWTDVALKPGDDNPLAGVSGELFDIQAEFEPGEGVVEFGFRIRGERVAYSTKDKTLTALGSAPLELRDGRLRLRVLVDRTSLETFADDGRVTLSSCFLPDAADTKLELFTLGGNVRIRSLEVRELKPATPTLAADGK
jgi:sucrose-6-phosphate hydrolase SacC (GH32 family)